MRIWKLNSLILYISLYTALQYCNLNVQRIKPLNEINIFKNHQSHEKFAHGTGTVRVDFAYLQALQPTIPPARDHDILEA